MNIVFAPTTTGVLTVTLTITDSDITSPQVVTLTGTGIQAGSRSAQRPGISERCLGVQPVLLRRSF